MHCKGQGIRNSGMGGPHHNEVADNIINNVVKIARAMMINAALRWPDASEKILCLMAMAHDVHLNNHNPHISSGMSTEEVWKRYKSSHSNLHNAHPWIYPAYVLEPRLQYRNNLPTWIPRSIRYQYLEASKLHTSTVGLVRNLQTGNIRPQFHLIFDDYCETVHA